MANSYFRFKQYTVYHDRCAMKVTTDSCLFGAWAAQEIQKSTFNIQNLLDIGTGTGLLSLMIAQKNDVETDAVEIDKDAADQAKENVEASPWKNRIHVFNQDILSFQPSKKYDCIICNPPFYENELTSETQKKNIAHHSEKLTVLQVLHIIQAYLKEGGLFFLLYPFKRKEAIEKLLQQNELLITESILLRQSVNHAPFRVIAKGSNKKAGRVKETPLSIWNEHQQYTSAFAGLLKEYYLYL